MRAAGAPEDENSPAAVPLVVLRQMRKSTRSILFLALATAVLGATVWAQLARERSLVPQPLTALDPESIRSIQIRCAECRTRRFERDAGGWRMLEPYAQPASAEAVARLLRVVRAPVRTRASLREYDPAKLGLAPAQFTLRFDQVTIEIGNEDPIEHDRYVRVGEELLRVPDRFSARLLESPESELAETKASR
jgi:hypothetical protein